MENKLGKILIIDDNEDVLISAKLLLKKHCQKMMLLNSPTKAEATLAKENFDIILLDMNFTEGKTGGEEGFYWLQKILEIDPQAIVIFITAYGDIEKAVEGVKAGATNFVSKPWENEKLLATLKSAQSLANSRKELAKAKIQQQSLSDYINQPFNEIIGKSAPMQQVYRMIKKVAATPANILITGENGTGKELVARAIHRGSDRRKEIFLGVDVGSLNESLFESELFGYEKGAFTDAKQKKTGRFEVASGGTLFLDEIGNLSLNIQSKLLRVLETREFTPVGGTRAIPFDVRLICATNANLQQMIQQNEFREDLLYRINTVEILLPPLRDRKEDIPVLLNFFLKKYAEKYKQKIEKFSPSALQKLKYYDWPGNVRELRHTVERAVIMCEDQVIEEECLLLTKGKKMEQLQLPDFNLEKIEQHIIEEVFRKYDGNISKMAEVLGLTRASLYRRLKKYDI
ncbi:MAG: sigma-54-dependent Fis family transcriptional regulator [Candidatus Marinimicrobia bacterium]|nr:sigma-54-dependent Fis family transcriptional regulator [Candidatus Neomarinimicrobiota bacterium]